MRVALNRTALAVGLAALLTACAGSSAAPTPGESLSASPSPPQPTAIFPLPSSVRPSTPVPTWVVGARPLPLRPDGFGQVLPTPRVLRDRRLPTVDVLPPPREGPFVATTNPISRAVRTRMGQTWSPRCPVGLEQLRHLTVSFRGFDGRPHTGELVVAASVAADVVRVFRALYAIDFPIEEMRLPTTADLTAAPTGDGSNTAAYVCRAARGQQRFSAHAYGTAIDINPFHNPHVKRDLVLPELASAYTDRSWRRPGMITPGSPAVRAFDLIGWKWGGTYRSSKDWMHFSLSGL